MSIKQTNGILNLKVLVRNVEKNCSSIYKLSYLFFKTLKLSTLLSSKYHVFQFLQEWGRLNLSANFDPLLLQTF